VRRRVRDICPGQRPEAEGRFGRLLFQTVEADLLTTLPVSDVGAGRVRLSCAPLLGVSVGDTFTVMPADAVAADPATKVGDLRIDRVGPLAAEGPLVFAAGHSAVPIGARAHRETVAAPTIPVLLPADPRAEDLARAVGSAPLIRAAEPGDYWQAAVRIDAAGQLTIEDRIGPLHPPRANDAGGVRRVVRDLNALARAAALRNLAADGPSTLGAAVTVEWGVVEDGRPRPLPERGAVVSVGAKQYISVRNNGPDDVFIALIDLGVAGRVAVLTDVSPSGERLAAGREYVFGLDGLDGVLSGEPLTWPEALDATRVRPETALLLVTSAPHDVSVLEQGGVVRTRTRPVTSLQAVFDQIGSGRGRDAGRARGPEVRYDLRTIEFELDPGVAAVAGAPAPVEPVSVSSQRKNGLDLTAQEGSPAMSKRIVVGQSEWTFPEGDVAKTLELIKSAMENGTVAELDLVDAAKEQVTVYLNGATVQTLAVSMGDAARPSEIS
jgi:hypothetical protein